MLFTVSFMVLWVTIIATQINVDANRDEFREGFRDWAACLFSQFNGQPDSTAACGAHPRYTAIYIHTATYYDMHTYKEVVKPFLMEVTCYRCSCMLRKDLVRYESLAMRYYRVSYANLRDSR
jgi:hypothetical protein